MKKLFFVFAAVAALSFSTTSCKKCGHCDYGGGISGGSLCTKDSKAAYDVYKSACEGTQGAKWVTD